MGKIPTYTFCLQDWSGKAASTPLDGRLGKAVDVVNVRFDEIEKGHDNVIVKNVGFGEKMICNIGQKP
jgi:hypothetical protein